MKDIYKIAAQKNLKFQSPVRGGEFSVADLFDFELDELNQIGKVLHSQIKADTEVDFLDENKSADPVLELKLDIIKDVIATKKAEATFREKAAKKDERLRKLYSALANRKEADMAEMSQEDIEAEIDQLTSAETEG